MKIMKCFLICTVVCFLFVTDCYAKAWTGTNEIDYVDDGVQCLPKGKFDRYRVVSRKVKNIEVMGIKHSKWMRITDVYRANTGRDHQTVSALPIYKDKQNITIILVSHSMEDVANYVDRILVMDKGSIIMDGDPKHIYMRSDELEAMGLSAPQVTYLMRSLRERGFDLDPGITTIDDAVKEILRLVPSGRKAGR